MPSVVVICSESCLVVYVSGPYELRVLLEMAVPQFDVVFTVVYLTVSAAIHIGKIQLTAKNRRLGSDVAYHFCPSMF